MTENERKRMDRLEQRVKELALEVKTLKHKKSTEFEWLETDSCLVQTYN